MTTPPPPPMELSREITLASDLNIVLPRIVDPVAEEIVSTYGHTAAGTITTGRYTEVQITKHMITDDLSSIGNLLPSLFRLRIPSKIASTVSYMRRSLHIVHKQCPQVNGMCYAVVVAPIESSVYCTIKTIAKKHARAVFIVQGSKLFYRLEFMSLGEDTAEVEHCTYDISKLLPFYAPVSNSTSFY